MLHLSRAAAAASAVALFTAAGASAQTILGLTSDQRFITFDAANPSSILSTSPAISGLSEFDGIADLDWYPVNGLVYGLGSGTGHLYALDPSTGVATFDVAPQTALTDPAVIDFNPAADRLRIFSLGGENFRLTPSLNRSGPTGADAGLVSDDGSVAYPGGSPTPQLVAAAYTNSVPGAVSTTLYSIDAGDDSLVIHSGGPQFSMLSSVGSLGISIGASVGFDIGPNGTAYLSNGNEIYTVNLATGEATSIGTVGSEVELVSITVIPAPGAAIALAGFAGVLAARRRRA